MCICLIFIFNKMCGKYITFEVKITKIMYTEWRKIIISLTIISTIQKIFTSSTSYTCSSAQIRTQALIATSIAYQSFPNACIQHFSIVQNLWMGSLWNFQWRYLENWLLSFTGFSNKRLKYIWIYFLFSLKIIILKSSFTVEYISEEKWRFFIKNKV